MNSAGAVLLNNAGAGAGAPTVTGDRNLFIVELP